jgi:hypothetical protein
MACGQLPSHSHRAAFRTAAARGCTSGGTPASVSGPAGPADTQAAATHAQPGARPHTHAAVSTPHTGCNQSNEYEDERWEAHGDRGGALTHTYGRLGGASQPQPLQWPQESPQTRTLPSHGPQTRKNTGQARQQLRRATRSGEPHRLTHTHSQAGRHGCRAPVSFAKDSPLASPPIASHAAKASGVRGIGPAGSPCAPPGRAPEAAASAQLRRMASTASSCELLLHHSATSRVRAALPRPTAVASAPWRVQSAEEVHSPQRNKRLRGWW